MNKPYDPYEEKDSIGKQLFEGAVNWILMFLGALVILGFFYACIAPIK